VRYETGDLVLREGEYSDSAYFVVDGAAEVVLTGESDQRPTVRGGAHVPAAQRPERAAGRRALHRARLRRPLRDGDPLRASRERGAGPRQPHPRTGRGVRRDRRPVALRGVGHGASAATPLTVLQIRLPGLRMLLASSKDFKKSVEERYRERILARSCRMVPLFSRMDDPSSRTSSGGPSSSPSSRAR
jgi:hypothetical protein